MCQLLRTNTLPSGSKYIKHFFLFLPVFPLYMLSERNLFNMPCLSYISLKASLDILYSNLLNLKNEIMKIGRRNILWPIKILKTLSLHINIFLKYFMNPTKTLRPSLHVWSLKFFREVINERSEYNYLS